MPKKTSLALLGVLIVAVALGWWLWGWYQQMRTDVVLLERLEQLGAGRDWRVQASRTDSGFVTTQIFILHQGEVVRASDETPGRDGAPHYIVKNGKFYSLINDYEIFESRQTVPRAFIETDLALVSAKPALAAAYAAMRQAFPLYYTLLFLKDREAFQRDVAGGEAGESGSIWRQESPDMYVRADDGKWPVHLPQSIRFSEVPGQLAKVELRFANVTSYPGPGPVVELTFTPVDDLDAALRFPADYVRVEATKR